MKAGGQAAIERGGDSFRQQYQHIALLVVIVLYLKQSNSLVVLAKMCREAEKVQFFLKKSVLL